MHFARTLVQVFYVYVLQEVNERKLYIGYSANLRSRVAAHQSNSVTSTKNGEYKLIYYEAYLNKADALGREKFLKGGSGRKYIQKQLAHYFEKS